MILQSAAMAATALAGIVIIVSALAWVFKNWLKNYLQELKPNGGSSMADSIKRIETHLDFLTKEMIDHLKGHK
jgi:glyoxylate utilization-related uncharacterized protein